MNDLDRLFREYHQPLVRYLTRRLGDRDWAEEVTQETFLRAARQETIVSERAWLFAVATNLVRDDDEVVYADAGYQGAEKRPDVAGDEHLTTVQWRVAARKGRLQTMTEPDRAEESRKASVRAKVEHPFLIVKRDFGFTKTRYRGISKNLNHLHVLFASANWLMRARAVTLAG